MSEPGLPKEPFWNRSRALSLSVLAIYVLLAVGSRPNELNGVGIGALPALIIWFPELFSEYTGLFLSRGPAITKGTPVGCLVVVSWLVLFVPLVWMVFARSGLLGGR